MDEQALDDFLLDRKSNSPRKQVFKIRINDKTPTNKEENKEPKD
jgi:hypothetical protein